MLKIENISKTFNPGTINEKVALQDLSLHLAPGDFVTIIGSNGAGKSTTLKAVAGLVRPKSGEILLDGQDVTLLPEYRRSKIIGRLFQDPMRGTAPGMTIEENLALAAGHGGWLSRVSKGDKKLFRDKLALLEMGLEDRMSQPVGLLSGGQRQRVAVGRAIVRKPEVFLFDEPLSNLDAKMRVQMRTEISKLHTRLETTMIYVTHDQIEAMTMGDRICVMKDGLIQQVDTPLNIYDHPANTFVAGFIGTPPMNIFRGTIAKEEEKYFFKNENMSILLPETWAGAAEKFQEKEVLFGIRPEDIGSERAELEGNAQHIRAKIEVMEPMGAETYLYLDAATDNGVSCIARVDAHMQTKVGETLSLPLLVSNAHLFDPVSTNILV